MKNAAEGLTLGFESQRAAIKTKSNERRMLVSSARADLGYLQSFGALWPSARSFWRPAALVSILSMAGCTSEAPMTFDLDPSVPLAHVQKSYGQLAVYEPTAAPPLASRRIVVRTGADAIAYLHGGQWATNLPVLVQDRLIEAFETAHVLRAVGRPGLVADHSLHTDIQRFEVDVVNKQAIVEIYARLVAGNGRVLKDKLFSATVAAPDDHVPAVAAAISQAFSRVVHDIVIWAATRA